MSCPNDTASNFKISLFNNSVICSMANRHSMMMPNCMNATCCYLCIVKWLLTLFIQPNRLHQTCVYIVHFSVHITVSVDVRDSNLHISCIICGSYFISRCIWELFTFRAFLCFVLYLQVLQKLSDFCQNCTLVNNKVSEINIKSALNCCLFICSFDLVYWHLGFEMPLVIFCLSHC